MANLKTLSGFPIQNLTSDPVPFAQAKENNPYVGVWSSGGNLNTARNNIAGGNSATPSAGIAFGGYTGTAPTGATEEYNGTAWSEQNNLNTARSGSGGVGIQTAAMAISGNSGSLTAVNEQYDGTSWTEVADVNTARDNIHGGFGGNTSAVIGGGRSATPATYTGNTESWNGSAWTEVNDLNTARGTNHSSPSTSDGIAAGGIVAPPTAYNGLVETWNGTSWTETTDLNTVRGQAGSSGTSGSAFLLFGGESPPNPAAASKFTESWNGSAWTEVNDLATSHSGGVGGNGTATDALAIGGLLAGPGARTAATEEWAFTGIPPTAPAAGYSDAIVGQMYYNSTSGQFKAIESGGAPIGTWSSGGDMNTQGYQLFSFGTQTSAVRAGGYSGTALQNNAENYNGTAWTALSGINDSRSNEAGAGSGTYTAGLIYGGNTPPFANTVESWNGSSWTEVAEINTARSGVAGVGISTATLIFAGQDSPGGSGYTTKVESWNGSSWTETTDVNTARAGVCGIGQVYTAALAATGYNPSPSASGLVEDWDGTSWTEVAEVNTPRGNVASRSGTSTDGLLCSGYSNPASARTGATEHWNGSSWTEVADLATGRYGIGGQGATSGAAVAFGGNTAGSDPAGVVTTEEFTASDFQIKSVTTS